MGNMSSQFHCIYGDKFFTCKRNGKFTSICKHKAKLKSQLQTETLIDVLPTKQDSQPSQLPGAPEPLPGLVEPWNSQPEPSSPEYLHKTPLAALPSESLKEPLNSQPDM